MPKETLLGGGVGIVEMNWKGKLLGREVWQGKETPFSVRQKEGGHNNHKKSDKGEYWRKDRGMLRGNGWQQKERRKRKKPDHVNRQTRRQRESRGEGGPNHTRRTTRFGNRTDAILINGQ